jgi:hypothetical protein
MEVQPRTSAEEWQKRIERWRESGLTADQFAAEAGVNAGTLRFWGHKLNKAKREAVGFVAPPKKRRGAARPFVEVRATASAASFELELGNGRRLRVPNGFEPEDLERLLELLERK